MFAFIIILNLLVCLTTVQAETGFFCVPIADLVAAPFAFDSKLQIKNGYDSLSASPEQGKGSCLRVHQGLFNESVTIVAYKNDQVQIILKNCISKSMMGFYDEPVNVWTYKDWIVTQDEIDRLGIEQSVFPKIYDAKTRSDESIITLTFPWYDETTQVTYSAGTRLSLASVQNMHDHYAVLLYDPSQKNAILSYVPQSNALVSGFFTPQERKKIFVDLLYAWCNEGKLIPFVWGGTSFTQGAQDTVVLKKWFTDGAQLSSWDCSPCFSRLFSGLDASGLILRAAQICGIPYYCSNSRTVANTLFSVPYSELDEGDILWAPGYVGIIASLDNNEIIEAQGYSRGYGVVHRITLKKRFADIETWNDFIICCENNIPLKSLDSQGRPVSYVPLFKIYRLPDY